LLPPNPVHITNLPQAYRNPTIIVNRRVLPVRSDITEHGRHPTDKTNNNTGYLAANQPRFFHVRQVVVVVMYFFDVCAV